MNFFQKIGAAIASIFSKTVDEVEVIATSANTVVNGLKDFVQSPTGQTIEQIIDTFVPGAATVLKGWLPDFFIAAGWAQAEFTKSKADIVNDGMNYLVNIADEGLKAGHFNTLVANLSTKIAEVSGVDLPIQHALIVPQIVYKGLPIDNSVAPATQTN